MTLDREYKLCDVSSSLYSKGFNFVPRALRLPGGWSNVQPRAFHKSLGTSLANIVVVYIDLGEIVVQSQEMLLHLLKPGRKTFFNN